MQLKCVKYYFYSLITLKGLLEKWEKGSNQFPRLIEETKLGADFLEKNA